MRREVETSENHGGRESTGFFDGVLRTARLPSGETDVDMGLELLNNRGLFQDEICEIVVHKFFGCNVLRQQDEFSG